MAARLALSADVIAIAPEFTTSTAIDTWLAIAAQIVSVAGWGTRTSDGHALLTAHFLASTPAEGGAAAGANVASESDGPASRSFFQAPATDELLSTTFYGRAYMALRRTVPQPAAVVAGRCPW